MSADSGMNSVEPTERIVSVNSRAGGTANSIAAKLGLVILLVALAMVGGVMALHRYWVQRAAAAKASEASSQNERPKASTARHHFNDTAPPAAAKVEKTQADHTPSCDDGGPSQMLAGIDGKPMSAPDGQPVRICRNGQLLFPLSPGLPPKATGTTAPAPLAAPSPPLVPATSRYSGDVLLPAATALLSPPSLQSIDSNSVLPAMSASIAPGIAAARPAAETTPANTVANPQGNLRALLQAAPTASVQATLMGDRDLILPEGRTIDCNLSLRVISEVSGKAVCVLSSAVFGDSGNVVLAEQGSVATGDYIAVSAQGQRRLFILWTRLKTTKGVLVNLNSPAADALGTSGLEGYVDNRWGERVGAAFLLSTVQDAIGYETAKSTAGNGNGNAATGLAVFQNTTEAGNRLAERILESTINIKPTIYKNQGDRASITVARDLDFGSVYALRTK